MVCSSFAFLKKWMDKDTELIREWLWETANKSYLLAPSCNIYKINTRPLVSTWSGIEIRGLRKPAVSMQGYHQLPLCTASPLWILFPVNNFFVFKFLIVSSSPSASKWRAFIHDISATPAHWWHVPNQLENFAGNAFPGEGTYGWRKERMTWIDCTPTPIVGSDFWTFTAWSVHYRHASRLSLFPDAFAKIKWENLWT